MLLLTHPSWFPAAVLLPCVEPIEREGAELSSRGELCPLMEGREDAEVGDRPSEHTHFCQVGAGLLYQVW